MILEIVTPYDAADSNDTHTSYKSLFRKLSEMVDGGKFEQTEIEVVQWESYEQRDEMRCARDFEPQVVLIVDDLT